VALFHDIKTINKEAIPLLIDLGRCLGMEFISSSAMMKEPALTRSGIIVDRKQDLKVVGAEVVKKIELANQKVNSPNQCNTPSNQPKTCTSENGRTYQDCQGEESICFDGRFWCAHSRLENNNWNDKY
jgi:hypothetical protein